MLSKTKRQNWLLKTEPETYSFEQLLKDKRTPWNGVRNFQARNFLKQMKKGDLALIYHSGDVRAAVGLAEVVKEFYPDTTPMKSKDDERAGDWVQVDLKPLFAFKNPVSLKDIKANPTLQEIKLIKQSRLSVMPIIPEHQQELLKMSGCTLKEIKDLREIKE